MHPSSGCLLVGLAALAFASACGGKKVEADATLATPTPATTVAAPADTAVTAAPDTTAAAPEAAAETTPDSPDSIASAALDAPAADALADDDATPPGDAGDAGEGHADALGAADDSGVGAEKTFAQMTGSERSDFMKKVVLPKVRPAFRNADPKEFAKMNCAPCHGPNARETQFEMPNPKLTKLPSTPAGWKKLAAKEAKMMAFMKDELTPMMAELLHEAPFDPKTGKGFGCLECHTQE
jgi:hypothetical protein